MAYQKVPTYLPTYLAGQVPKNRQMQYVDDALFIPFFLSMDFLNPAHSANSNYCQTASSKADIALPSGRHVTPQLTLIETHVIESLTPSGVYMTYHLLSP